MRTLSSLLLLLLSIELTAQTKIVGFVKLQSSGNQALRNAEVWAIGAASKPLRFSNTKGYFELEFPGKKAGDVVREVTVTLDGYEVVNKKDLENCALLSRPDDDPLLIVLCKQGEYRKAAADYYQTIYQAGEAELQAEKKRLEQEKQNDAAVQKQLTDINKKLENLPQVAEAAADYFAKIDLDQATQLQKNALAELKKGNIQAALDAMPEDVMDKNMTTAQQRKQQLEAQLAETNQVIKQNIENYRFKAQLFVSQGAYAEAERLYEKAVLADTTNIENLYDHAVFLEEINRYDKALLWLQKVTVAKTDAWRIANAWGTMGQGYEETGDFIHAPLAYARAEALYDSLYRRQPDNDFYKNNLAISYSKLGDIYQAQGNFDTALVFFLKFNQFNEELYRDNPKSEALKRVLAISYQRIGRINQNMGNYQLALTNFSKYLKLSEELAKDNPSAEKWKQDLATAYNNIGEIYQAQGKIDTALVFFQKYNQLGEELYRDNPKSEALKNGLAISYSRLGDIYQAQGKFDTDLVFYQKALMLYEELYKINPLNISNKEGLINSYSNLAWGKLFMKRFQEAEQSARQSISLGGKSAEWVYNNLALSLLYQGKYEEAEAIFNQYKDKPHPWAPRFKTYKDATIYCLDELEKAGITHPDVAKVRKLLRD